MAVAGLGTQMHGGRGQPGGRDLLGGGRDIQELPAVRGEYSSRVPLGADFQQAWIARERAAAAVGLVDEPFNQVLVRKTG